MELAGNGGGMVDGNGGPMDGWNGRMVDGLEDGNGKEEGGMARKWMEMVESWIGIGLGNGEGWPRATVSVFGRKVLHNGRDF
jgi:hypothetical protein